MVDERYLHVEDGVQCHEFQLSERNLIPESIRFGLQREPGDAVSHACIRSIFMHAEVMIRA